MNNPTFPKLTNSLREQRLAYPRGTLRMVLDTDTYNEIDDQFALVYALLAPERLAVEAIYAAPFANDHATGPGDGMQKSYEEILRLLERMAVPSENLVYHGSTAFLTGRATPERSPAALDLVQRALRAPDDDPLYVVAIGAITNVVSAMLIEPEIIKRIVVVWLGGHPTHLPTEDEFNLRQDPTASRLLFDSGVPLVQIPCIGVASHLLTSKVELEAAIAGRNAISDFLYQRFCDYRQDHFAWAKEIWDISTIAYLLNETWVPTQPIPAPVMHDDLTYHTPHADRHTIRVAWNVHRNPVFRDLFTRLQNYHPRGS